MSIIRQDFSWTELAWRAKTLTGIYFQDGRDQFRGGPPGPDFRIIGIDAVAPISR